MLQKNAIIYSLCAPQRKGGASTLGNFSTSIRNFCFAVLASIVANLITFGLMNL